MQQVETVEDNRSRRRNGRKNLHAHHLHDQAVSYGIRAHRVSEKLKTNFSVLVMCKFINKLCNYNAAVVGKLYTANTLVRLFYFNQRFVVYCSWS